MVSSGRQVRASQMMTVLSWLDVAIWRMSGDQAQAKPKSRWPRRGWTGRPVSDSITHASGESPITTRRRLSGDVAVQFIGWESS